MSDAHALPHTLSRAHSDTLWKFENRPPAHPPRVVLCCAVAVAGGRSSVGATRLSASARAVSPAASVPAPGRAAAAAGAVSDATPRGDGGSAVGTRKKKKKTSTKTKTPEHQSDVTLEWLQSDPALDPVAPRSTGTQEETRRRTRTSVSKERTGRRPRSSRSDASIASPHKTGRGD